MGEPRGGISFTEDDYPLEALAELLRQFAQTYDVQVYLEPGEAVITDAAELRVTVLDIVHNEKDIAIVDSATEAHRLDNLLYDFPAEFAEANPRGQYEYLIGSASCLAGDVFGTSRFDAPLSVGDTLHMIDAGGYSMVKLNWFNGLRMPSIYCRRSGGDTVLLNQFDYEDFERACSRWSVGSSHAVN